MADLLLADPHIPSAFRDIGYKDFRQNGPDGPVRRDIYKAITEWDIKEKPNLLLWGKPGLGKTFMAVASIMSLLPRIVSAALIAPIDGSYKGPIWLFLRSPTCRFSISPYS